MITLLKEPAEISFSRNRIPVRAESDAYIQVGGTVAITSFDFPTTPADDEILSFTWGDSSEFSVLLIFQPAPDGSGNQLPLQGAETDDEYAVIIGAALAANYEINERFQVLVLFGVISLIARDTGTEYDLTLGGTSPATIVSTTAGVDRELAENFRMLLDLYVEDVAGAGYVKVPTQEAFPDDYGVCEFDLQTLLHPFMKTQRPSFMQDTVQACHNINKKYYYELCEYYGETPTYYVISRSGVKRVIKGAMDENAHPDFADNVAQNYFAPSASFLMHQGSTIATTAKQHQYLFWLLLNTWNMPYQFTWEEIVETVGASNHIRISFNGNVPPPWMVVGNEFSVEGHDTYAIYEVDGNSFITHAGLLNSLSLVAGGTQLTITSEETSSANIELWGIAHYTDFTASAWTLLKTVTGYNYGETWMLPAGHDHCGIKEIDTNRTVRYYQLELRQTGQQLSERLTYVIKQPDFLDTYWLYENSFGAWDSSRFKGLVTPVLAVNKIEVERPLDLQHSSDHFSGIFRKAGNENSVKLNTGLLSARQYADLVELLDSEAVMRVLDKYIPYGVPAGAYDFNNQDNTHRLMEVVLVESKKHFGRTVTKWKTPAPDVDNIDWEDVE